MNYNIRSTILQIPLQSINPHIFLILLSANHNTTLYTTYNLFHNHICLVCGSYQCPYCPYYNTAMGKVTWLLWTLLSLSVSTCFVTMVYVGGRSGGIWGLCSYGSLNMTFYILYVYVYIHCYKTM